MLFNSYAFIFWFLPIIILGFFSIGKYSPKMASIWIVCGSLFFYGFWNPRYTYLLILSILINYIFGYFIGKTKDNNKRAIATILFLLALIINLGILSYYKYANFFLTQINIISGSAFSCEKIILPLGISFFTFTQIAFIVDVFQDKAKEHNLIHYCLFVTYFPHLIAGPILHHAEMLPQFLKKNTYHFSKENISIGTLIFIVGLAKKMFADQLAPYADTVFSATTSQTISFYEGWLGALSYTFQIYFDFSGYCDMAIGLSKMLNIQLPINFNSPYKAKNIIDFWRRWHITLSRFLRDYLYIPLGGNRHGSRKRYRNLLITMVLGGLWHGASWNFILWGTLHGIYLTINHAWQNLLNRFNYIKLTKSFIYISSTCLLTFLMVIIAWVFFRAIDIHSAINILTGMSGLRGFSIPSDSSIFQDSHLFYYLFTAIFVCFFLPNTQQIFYNYTPGLKTYREDIPPYYFFKHVNFPALIKMRYFGYLWTSYALSIIFIILFYSKNLDAKILHHLPTKEGLVYVDMTQGDYRTNLFANDIFRGKEHKVVIVGSSYTQIMGRFKFLANGIHYKSASVGNAGNSLSNGFRTAVVILNNFKIDTLIFGVSPIGFEQIKNANTSITLENQCAGALNEIDIKKSIKPFSECTPKSLTVKEMIHIALEPGNDTFFQFHNFLNKLIKLSFSPTFSIEGLQTLSEKDLKKYDDWYKKTQLETLSQHLEPALPTNGNDKQFHWKNRNILESMDESGDIYTAFKELKKLADKKGVKLVVYNSPTVSSKQAPHIYPMGFLEAYRNKLSSMMDKLGISYYDFQDEFIWDDRYTNDFVHLSFYARERIHAKLINNIFFKENTA